MQQLRGKDVGLTKVGSGTSGSFTALRHQEATGSISSTPQMVSELKELLSEDYPNLSDEYAAAVVNMLSEWQADNPWSSPDALFEKAFEFLEQADAQASAEQKPEPLVEENYQIFTAQDAVLVAAGRNPDDYLEQFMEHVPELLPGFARTVLHNTVDAATKDRGSQLWRLQLGEFYHNAVKEQKAPLYAMTPTRSDLDHVLFSTSWAVENEKSWLQEARLAAHRQLPQLSVEQFDAAFDKAVSSLEAGDKDWAEPLHEAANINAALQHPETAFDFNYQPPGHVAVEGYMGAPGFRGQLHDEYRSIKDINKDVRAELKRAQEAGYIPQDLKISVRGKNFRGGRSMDVNVSGTGADRISLGCEDENWEEREQLSELRNRISGIIDSWNYDTGNSQYDYSNVNYYSHVNMYD